MSNETTETLKLIDAAKELRGALLAWGPSPLDAFVIKAFDEALAAWNTRPTLEQRALDALEKLLADSQHSEHSCGDLDPHCPVDLARALLREAGRVK